MNVFQQNLLRIEIKQAIELLGFENPTPIQQAVIPHILDQKGDLVALAQTGTGKTAAFGLPIIQKITSENFIQALVLAPTRELVQQISKDFKNYSKFIQKINIATVYGGANIATQIEQVKKGVQIVVGTPGRTLDLIKRRVLDLTSVKYLVLDEADEMLNMGFKEELDEILENTPSSKQTFLFSATMPDEVRQISHKYLNNPAEIAVGKVNVGAENIEHHLYLVNQSDKYIALRRIIDFYPDIYALIFCRTREETKHLAKKLMDDGYSADALHGDLSQYQRDFVMYRFRIRQIKLLIATDVAARGLDISDLTHVINYDLPEDHEIYIHRSGRTARAGKNGISVIIASPRDERRIRYIEKIIGKRITTMKIPTGKEICNNQLFNLLDNIKRTDTDDKLIEPFVRKIETEFEGIDKIEILKKIISIEFNRLLLNYKNSADININYIKNQKKSSNTSSENFETLEINLGRRDALKPHSLIGLINQATDSNNIEIGRIQIKEKFSTFEIDKSYVYEVINSLKGQRYNGFTIKIGTVGNKSKNSNKTSQTTKEQSKNKTFKTQKYYKER